LIINGTEYVKPTEGEETDPNKKYAAKNYFYYDTNNCGYNIPLEGSEKYHVIRKIVARIPLKSENCFIWLSKTFLLGTRVILMSESRAEDAHLEVEFAPVGTPKSFQIPHGGNLPRCQEFIYSGLIFPRQGYILNLKVWPKEAHRDPHQNR
jgi:hypothetical protein